MSSPSGGDIRRSLELMWQGVPEPARGPRPSLSLTRVVRAAIDVADSEGLGALSMRRIAAELDAGAMSLYRYVPGKGELVDLMVDEVYGEDLAARDVTGDWRARLEYGAHQQMATYLRHPWMLQIAQGRPLLGPNSLRATELAIRDVDGIGLDEHEMVAVVVAVGAYVTGMAGSTIDAMQAADRTGVSDEEWWAAHEPHMVDAVASGELPMMERIGEAGVWQGTFDAFAFGLERLLDGIAVLVETRRAADPGPS